MRPPAPRQRGFTMIEMMIVVSLLGLSLATITGVFKTSSNLASDSRATLRVHEEHRRNLECIATKLRAGKLDTFTNFVGGSSTNPFFECVVGVDQDGLLTAGPEELLWAQAPQPVDNVGIVGTVRHKCATGSTLVADRVPKDGFSVRMDGDNVIVRLTTYYTTSEGKTALLTGETAVFVRN
jgi:prepilin-type N-terminal cleavage/methylation domain-containing protein